MDKKTVLVIICAFVIVQALATSLCLPKCSVPRFKRSDITANCRSTYRLVVVWYEDEMEKYNIYRHRMPVNDETFVCLAENILSGDDYQEIPNSFQF
jgi:hypothetical protein